MPEDRRPIRAPRIQSDDERAVAGKRRTPPQGFPVYVDPELTPPPQEPPRPETLPGYSTIAPPVRQQLDAFHDELATVTRALGRVWDERGNGERIVRLETAVTGYTKQIELHQETIDKFVMPAIKASTARVESLLIGRERVDQQLSRWFETDLPRLEEVIDRLATSVTSLADRLGKLEFSATQLHASDVSLQTQIGRAFDTITVLDARIAKVEKARESEALVETTEAAQRKRWFTAARVVGAVAFTTAGWLVAHLPGWLG